MTAFLGALIVALGAETIVPDDLADPRRQDILSFSDRFDAADQAARADDYGPAITVDAGRPNVWVLPLRDHYTITTNFEMRWGSMHFGVDLAAAYYTPIYATHAGTVLLAEWYGGYGNAVMIDNGEGVVTIFGHASELLVSEGQQVQAGQMIARVGSTGYSTGEHLHYEITVNGGQYDPIRFMREHGVDLESQTEEATGGIVG